MPLTGDLDSEEAGVHARRASVLLLRGHPAARAAGMRHHCIAARLWRLAKAGRRPMRARGRMRAGNTNLTLTGDPLPSPLP